MQPLGDRAHPSAHAGVGLVAQRAQLGVHQRRALTDGHQRRGLLQDRGEAADQLVRRRLPRACGGARTLSRATWTACATSSGSFRVPLAELLFLPIFVAAVRTFDLVGDVEGRATVGRTVVRRARWSAPARRSSASRCTSTSRVPRCAACFVAAARARGPGAPFELTEMLPGPEDCWLETKDGPHTSELRLVAVDRAAPTP